MKYGIICAVFTPFGRGAVVAQLTVNQLVAGSNPAARASEDISPTLCFIEVDASLRPLDCWNGVGTFVGDSAAAAFSLASSGFIPSRSRAAR